MFVEGPHSFLMADCILQNGPTHAFIHLPFFTDERWGLRLHALGESLELLSPLEYIQVKLWEFWQG